MGQTIAIFFLAFLALGIAQTVIRRTRNPYGDVQYHDLPAPLRLELERILPDFEPRTLRATRNREEVRMEGRYGGDAKNIEVEFDPDGELIELEIDAPEHVQMHGPAQLSELTRQARQEIERITQTPIESLERVRVKRGTVANEDHFEVDAIQGQWDWEITVSATGRLLELDKERLRQV